MYLIIHSYWALRYNRDLGCALVVVLDRLRRLADSADLDQHGRLECWRLGNVARASSGRPERPQQQLEIGCKISNPPSYAHVLAHPGPP
jgi:hypothetical protein